MIQKYLKVPLAAIALCLGVVACTETSQLEEVVLPVPAEETAGFPRGPIKADTTLTLKVLYRPENGCGRFSRVDSVKTGQRTDIQIFVAYPTEDQEAVCADIAKLVTYSFQYRPATPGIHRFRFWQADNSYLLDSLIVQ
ncbi:hypothetical protein [Rufibacter latericius]|uniref:Uncharacterized protein n=1 Tax=Rufibacter latericius TaxID=2487040 RepID=A0A3M9MAC5_9BACT|nr:hypothetical protein [Rufibacter latericius]RNI22466.1 hypothetical protein EFB08_20390 [Rufibacter latericius]